MTCREFEADIVELARRTEADARAAERLRAHLEWCADCAARLERERQLTAALKAMAGAEPPSARAAAIEAQLLAAFAERRGAASRQAPASRSGFAAPAMRGPAGRGGRSRIGGGGLAGRRALDAIGGHRCGNRGWSRGAGGQSGGAARPAGGGQTLQFVALPTAIGLPALESGRIVRVQFPAAELPAYGFDVTPQPDAGAVEADLLVGQDGQPRAIRFVTLEADSRRPQ